MGYYAQAWAGDSGIITIPNDKIDDACKAVIDWLTANRSYDWFGGDEAIGDALREWGFDCDENEADDLLVIGFDGKWHDHNLLLDSLAPYCTPDSSLAFIGEDGALWRWTPKGEQGATVTWS